MLHDDDDVGAVLAECVRCAAHTRRADHERVDFASARGVDERARGRHGLERDLPKRGAARFSKHKNV